MLDMLEITIGALICCLLLYDPMVSNCRCLVCLTESSHLHHPVSNLACLNHRTTIFSNHLHSLSSTFTTAATRHPRIHHLFDEAQTREPQTRIEFSLHPHLLVGKLMMCTAMSLTGDVEKLVILLLFMVFLWAKDLEFLARIHHAGQAIAR
ncbi:hypothetical protein DVH24_007351 [Malus domestica]|uniref:Secreted protein n=1 Tax=Malus domestica TaxID=3750 RepID=A0A498HKQ3_MALDO|nr:hypothetical protein DVH24_007351 [Malus domestica]